ncbi:MAG TPA: hypothetical protein VNN72_07255 [Polyangiaceae bacterium]|nr:hypothetical protein [Polyangiaceae bacterium]
MSSESLPNAFALVQHTYRDAFAVFPLTVWIGIAVALVLVGVGLLFVVRDRRLRSLKARFGEEYGRAVDEYGSEAAAVQELRARERRVRRLRLRSLNMSQRQHVNGEWVKVRMLFIENPLRAVRNANHIVKTILHERGYRDEDFEHRLEDLSVDHASILGHYRAARALTEQEFDPRTATEDLRQAMVHYDAIIEELKQPTAQAKAQWQELRAH